MVFVPAQTGCEPEQRTFLMASGSGACGSIALEGTPEDIAATPRQNPNLELLTLTVRKGITADEALYQRIVRDIDMIRTEETRVAHIRYFPLHDGKGLLIGIKDSQTHQRILKGEHAVWNCLADYYTLVNVKDFPSGGSFGLLAEFKGIYNLAMLADVFAQLDGVEYAEPNWYSGDGPTICVTRANDRFLYVFDDASGDCPAGCIDHVYSYFTTTPDGQLTFLGTYEYRPTQRITDPPPDWAEQFSPCP